MVDSSHATRLKWRPYRVHAAQASDVANSDDDSVFSEAKPLGGSGSPRVVHDSAVVQAEATAPATSPFGDDAKQSVAQLSSQPAPAATNPDTSSLTQPAPGQFPTPTTGPNVAPQNSPYNLQPLGPAPLNTNSSDAEDLSCATHTIRCEKDETALRQNTINKISLDIMDSGKQGDTIPCECTIGTNVEFHSREWCLLTYTWKAAALCHKPLYFEEVQLERYGHSAGPIVEPLLSAAHFFITVPLLPYYMGVDPPLECQYTLGYYRPGDCAPYMLDPFPLSVRGAVLEAGAVVGITSVIP